MRHEDEGAVAQLHREVFPDYRSTWLGHRFCVSLIHAYSVREDTVALVSTSDQGIVGYLVACPPESQRAVANALAGRAAFAAARVLLTANGRHRARSVMPRQRAQQILRSLVRRTRGRLRPRSVGVGDDATRTSGRVIRLVLIGVAPAARGTGVSDYLLIELGKIAKQRGYALADLTVARDNVAARRCYERNGWGAVGSDSSGASLRYELPL